MEFRVHFTILTLLIMSLEFKLYAMNKHILFFKNVCAKFIISIKYFDFIKLSLFIFNKTFWVLGFLITIDEILKKIFGIESTLLLFVREHIFYFILLVVVYSLFKNRKKVSYKKKLRERDSCIEIRVGNAFLEKGEIVVPTNTDLDFKHGGRSVSEGSMQGQLVNLFYKKNPDLLKNQIKLNYPELFNENGQVKNKLEIGKVLRVDNKFILLVSSGIMSNGTADSNDDDLYKSLSGLWDFLISEGKTENIIIPLIGTGYSRHKRTRERTIKDIISSFIAACSNGSFCTKLIIIVNFNDLELIEKIEDSYHFLECKVESTLFDSNANSVSGSVVSSVK